MGPKMPNCTYNLQSFANPPLITIQILNAVLFQTRNSLKVKENDWEIEDIEDICDTKVWSIEYYGSNINTLQ